MTEATANTKFLENFKEPASDAKIKLLIIESKDGNQAAFGELYELYFDRIYRFIYYRVNHKEIAEDLTEDVFIKAWKSIRTVKEDSFGGWIYQIAKNIIIDHYRKQRITVDLFELENILESAENLPSQTDTIIDRATFIKFLKQLTPEQQIVIQLKFIEDLSNEEISDLISKSVGSIRVTQHRAIQRLQELFKTLRKND